MRSGHPIVRALFACLPGLVWAALLCGCTADLQAQTFDPEQLKQLVREHRDSVVLLRGSGRGASQSRGTGFFLQDGRVVTNWHVVAKVRGLQAVLTDGTEIDVTRVLARDEAHDLAVLQLAETPATIDGLDLATPQLAEQGEPILVIGSPLGLGGSASTGIVAAHRSVAELRADFNDIRAPNDAVLLQITAGISPGSSGSPVLDRGGAVVGVVVAQYQMSQNLNFAIPVDELHRLLARPVDDPVLDLDPAQAPAVRPELLRNLLISAFFFGVLWLIYRRLR